MIGEATRIPFVQEAAKEVFGIEQVSRTQNSQECVARGASLQAAMISPNYKVADFQIEDYNSFPTQVAWTTPDGNYKSKILFDLGCNFPSVKSLTFDKRKEPMDVAISYQDGADIVKGIPTLLGRYKINALKPKEDIFSLVIKVKVDINGIAYLSSSEMVEEYMEEKKIAVKKDTGIKATETKKEDKPAEGDKPAEAEKPAEAAKAPVPAPEQEFETKQVKKTRKSEVEYQYEIHGYGKDQLANFQKLESRQLHADNLLFQTKAAKNDLEGYVYEMRAFLSTVGSHIKYMVAEQIPPFIESCNQIEAWLYEEGKNASRDVYETKLCELRQIGDPVKNRQRLSETLPPAIQSFTDGLAYIQGEMEKLGTDPAKAHITQEDKTSLQNSYNEACGYIQSIMDTYQTLPTHENPPTTPELVQAELEKLGKVTPNSLNSQIADKILNKSAPTPPKEQKKAEPSNDKKEEAPKTEETPAEKAAEEPEKKE